MKRFRTLIVILMLLPSCSTSNSYSTFTIDNSSSLKIFVEYFDFANSDTTTIEIMPNNSEQIWEVTANSRMTNWYYDYGIHITHLTNVNGDTLLMNPNIASNWVMYAAGTDSYYHLPISDSSF